MKYSWKKRVKIFWNEDKVYNLKQYIASSEFRDHTERAVDIMDDGINTSIEIFIQALLTAVGYMLKAVKSRSARRIILVQHRMLQYDEKWNKLS